MTQLNGDATSIQTALELARACRRKARTRLFNHTIGGAALFCTRVDLWLEWACALRSIISSSRNSASTSGMSDSPAIEPLLLAGSPLGWCPFGNGNSCEPLGHTDRPVVTVARFAGGGGEEAASPSYAAGESSKSIETQHSHSRVSGGRRTGR